MQHVNVCLQAPLKRLGKACREQEKEKEGGVWRKNTGKEKQRGRTSPCAQCDRRQQGLCCPRHNIPSYPPHISITNFLHPLPLRASGKEHNTSHLTPFCAPSPTSLNKPRTGTHKPEHHVGVECARFKRRGNARDRRSGGMDAKSPHPSPSLSTNPNTTYDAFSSSNQTS
ncbi:hypothetical protein VZT92_015667 [Zoarces viviparus]|uniref:Uncharacterized protein n=1 Tax=Zoarces viviparus TaxID=48416 RepID=A0AAW1EWC3_ZOAVI